jgi:hypothetical protein
MHRVESRQPGHRDDRKRSKHELPPWKPQRIQRRAAHTQISMSKFGRGASAWKEHRIADAMTLNGVDYTVQLVARRGTGFQGYRVTLHFIPHAGGDEVQVELANASSTADVHRTARELTDDAAEVERLFRNAGAT